MSEKFPTDDEINCVAEDVALFAQRSDGWVNASYRLAVRMPAICDAARDRNRLERENEKLRAALKPFAKLIECYEAFHGRTFGDNASLSDLGSELDEATVGDLRRAAAALEGSHE